MKKAEDYLKKANNFYRCNIRMEDVFVNEEAALKAIKAAQLDAIDATVKRCAEKSLLSIDGVVEKSNGQTYLCDEGNHYTETWINIDRNSILQIAEELKKELE